MHTKLHTRFRKALIYKGLKAICCGVRIPPAPPNRKALSHNGSRLFSLIYKGLRVIRLCQIRHIVFPSGHIFSSKLHTNLHTPILHMSINLP